MYSFPYSEPVCHSMSSSNCCFPTCIQIFQEAGQLIWYSHLFKNFPVYCHPHVRGFGIVNKTEVNIFLKLSCFFDNPTDVGNLIFGSSAFSKTSLNIWKFMVHVLLKSDFENFEHYFTSVSERMDKLIKKKKNKQDPYKCVQEIYLEPRATYRLKVRVWKKIFHANRDQKKVGVAIIISDKTGFQIKTIKRDKERST